jgi:carboxymethylenebutenolidase
MQVSEDIQFPAADGRLMRAALAVPDGEGPFPAVLVVHEIFGLDDDIRRICGVFAEKGYVALAPDLWDRRAPKMVCIARAMRSLKRGEGEFFDHLAAAQRTLASRDDVDGDRVGVIGFCMGGGFALMYAVRHDVKVAAPFYGEVPDAAEDLEGVCPVLGGYGGADKTFGPKGARLEKHLEALGVDHDVKIYPGAGHSFMNQHTGLMAKLTGLSPMKVGYDPEAAEDSWKRIDAFFGRYLKGAPASPA